MAEQREVTYNEAAQFAKENGLIFAETSAKRCGAWAGRLSQRDEARP